MQSNGDRRKEYAALEKEHVAVEKEIQKHPHQRREDLEGRRNLQEGDPEAPAPKVTLPTPATEQRSLFQAPAPRAQKTTRRALQPQAQTDANASFHASSSTSGLSSC